MTEKKKMKMTDKQLLSIIWGYIKPHKNLFLLISTLLVITIIVSIGSPLLFHNVIAMVESRTNNTQKIIVGILSYLFIGLLAWLVNVILFLFITRLNSRFIRDIRTRAYHNVIRNKLSFFDQQKFGNVSSRLVYDTREMYETSIHLSWFIISLLQVLISIVVLFAFSVRIALWTTVMIPVIFLASVFLSKFERRQTRKWREKFSDVNHKFSEIMSKIQISKTFNREDENLRKFKDINEQTYRASVIRGLAIFIFWPMTDLFKHVFTFLVLYVGSLEVQNGMPISTFVLFLVMINYFYWPLISLAENYKSIQDVFASLARIAAIAHDASLLEMDEGTVSASTIDGGLSFNNVSFAYNEDNYVLRDISFNVKPGQRVALVGHTGAGKSTIGSLLMRFYEATMGTIIIDGLPIQKYKLNSLRTNMSIVSQKVLLFKGTIRENLLISNMDLSDDALWDVLERVQAREFIQNLPFGLDTIVEENGKNLSTGEKQMISFARALLSDPKVVIFDEATSAVDLYTESKILDAIDVVLEGRTAISIAHRLTTILNSDLIIVLENGRIIEQGTHEELLERKSTYAEMYHLYLQTQSASYLNKIRTRK